MRQQPYRNMPLVQTWEYFSSDKKWRMWIFFTNTFCDMFLLHFRLFKFSLVASEPLVYILLFIRDFFIYWVSALYYSACRFNVSVYSSMHIHKISYISGLSTRPQRGPIQKMSRYTYGYFILKALSMKRIYAFDKTWLYPESQVRKIN